MRLTAKRPAAMSHQERMALREVGRMDPEIQRAVWFEDDDPQEFSDETGQWWRLHQTTAGEWVRSGRYS